MRILLFNPYIHDFSAYDLWLRPVGLLYIAAVLRKYTDCEIHWIDVLDRFQNPPEKGLKSKKDGRGKFHSETIEKPDIYKHIPRRYSRYGMPFDQFKTKLDDLPEVDFIFITSLMTYWFEGIQFSVNHLRERFPRAKIVLGGILPTLLSKGIMRVIQVDDIIEGYGEHRILEYLKKEGVSCSPHPDLSMIDNIPFPAYEYLSNQKILPLLTSRGCPFKCTYCASNLLNPGFLERSADNIVEEVTGLIERYNPEHMVVFDDAFLINHQNRFQKVFTPIKSISGISFHTPNGLHAREITPEAATLLFRTNFKTIRLGFESIHRDILDRSSNKVTLSQMSLAIRNLENAGYRRKDLEVYLLFGLAGQNRNSMEETLLFMGDLGVIPRLAYYSPVPGTVDFRDLQKRGILSTEINLYETNKTYFVYAKSGLNESDIQKIKELTNHISRVNRSVT